MKKQLFSIASVLIFLLLLTSCKSREAQDVERQITSIGNVTEESYAAIQEARESYDALSDKDKTSVSNYPELENAELAYNTIFSERVDELIAAIGTVNDESGDAIALARSEYDKLSKEQKSIVKNFGILIDAEKAYEKYITDKLLETLGILSNIQPFDTDSIELAEMLLHKLTDSQRLQVENKVGDIDEIINRSRFQRVEKLIELITYTKGTPSKTELTSIIDALTAYIELDGDLQAQVANSNAMTAALKGYANYKKDRVKNDPLYARTTYISECKAIPYDDLMDYPNSYKGQKVSAEIHIIEIKEGFLLFPDSITAVIADTEQLLQIKDQRPVKEPVLSEEDTLTIYGIFEGTTTIKDIEEGSGLFGSNLFGNLSDKYDIPVIRFTYASNDNLGVIVAGDPSLTDIGMDEEAEALKEQLDQLVEQLH